MTQQLLKHDEEMGRLMTLALISNRSRHPTYHTHTGDIFSVQQKYRGGNVRGHVTTSVDSEGFKRDTEGRSIPEM